MKRSGKKAGVGRILLRILGILLAALLLTAAALFVIPLTEHVRVKTAEGSADWMARLDDSLRLNEIVIPGSHDSATQYSQLAFVTKCQALSIEEQLEAGYRYLDIRLGFGDTEEESARRLILMHGFTKCRKGPMPWDGTLYLKDVLDQCEAFLEKHPGETVIFNVKYEHGTDPVEVFENSLILGELQERGDTVLLTDTIPTLGEARGKLVLMRRFEDQADLGAKSGIPACWPDQGGNEAVSRYSEKIDQNQYQLWVQDRYCYGTEDKWDAFRAGIQESELGPKRLSIHFLSTKGTAAYGHPYHFARQLNDRLMKLPSEELRGWIIVDFGDAELAKHIWSANFK